MAILTWSTPKALGLLVLWLLCMSYECEVWAVPQCVEAHIVGTQGGLMGHVVMPRKNADQGEGLR